MSKNLAGILTALKTETGTKCSVCRAVTTMDNDTKEAFIDVMNSNVTIKAITDAMVAEGVHVSRFTLGEARRECVHGSRECPTFKVGKK
jgi:hypothetical protein